MISPILITSKRVSVLLMTLLLSISFNSMYAQTSPSDSIIGKVICGYQGWFNCYGDGSFVARWSHWSQGQYQSNNGLPAPGHLSFEMYPDLSMYNPSDLFQTGFGNLNNGQPAKLFSSYRNDVIDQHFSLMQKHGIDGVALQRFIAETFDGVYKANRDTVSVRVKRAAEKYDRIFYLMYDISGLAETKFDSIKNDWKNNMVGKLHLTSSSMYAKQNGKPVVCIWGLGFTDRSGTAALSLDLINWFKSEGCYVIGGVPTNWRTCTGDSKVGFENVYKAYDMISPWTVGRFANNTEADNFKNNFLSPDLNYCNTYGMEYQPVIFPGFAWSNWNGGPKNQIPRNKGEFMWRQMYNIKQLSVKSMYVAMFDEYDEGTAILSAADSYYMVPDNQYFLTTSADETYLSSDFYLRLVGKSTRVMKNLDALTTNVTIPFSEGPIYFRTSIEATFDAMPTWISTSDQTSTPANVTGIQCVAVTENSHIGQTSLKFSGTDNSATTSYCYFKVFDVNIPVSSETKLSFWNYPLNNLGRYISIDLVMTDGTNLRDAGAQDTNGISMHPGTGRGVVNSWTKNTCNIGQWLNGKTIDRIMIAYDQNPSTGNFSAFIDDISIYKNANTVTSIKYNEVKSNSSWSIYPNPSSNRFVVSNSENQKGVLNLYDLMGTLVMNQELKDDFSQVDISSLAKGVYIIQISSLHGNLYQRFVKE